MCSIKQKILRWKATGGEKVHDNRRSGMAEIILILAVLIVLTFIFREKLVELMSWSYRWLYR